MQPVPSDSAGLDELAARCLHPREIALLSPKATRKRRAEFIAGRIAARKAVSRLLANPSFESFCILRDGDGPTGRPTVNLNCVSMMPEVSISHADGLAVAAASHSRIGLDIALIETQDQSFIDEAFNPMELDRWAAWLRSEKTSALTLTTAFVAKEAALKWLGTGFGLPLHSIETIPGRGGLDEQPTLFGVQTSLFSIALIEKDRALPLNLAARFARIDDRISILLVGPDSAFAAHPDRTTAAHSHTVPHE